MGFEDRRQEAAPEEPRTIWRLDGPLLARRLHLAVPEGLCWQHLWPFLEDPPPHQPRGVHRLWNFVVIEWPHHRSSGLITDRVASSSGHSSRRRALLHLKSTQLSKRRAVPSSRLASNSSPPPLLRPQLASNSSGPATGSTMSASRSVCTCVSGPRWRSHADVPV